MINDFIVQAYPGKNLMTVILNGFFMKSEIELALYLASNEAKKLQRGFEVLVDIQNLKVAHKKYNLGLTEMKKVLKQLGAGNIRISDLNRSFTRHSFNSVGFYPYENEWFFS